LRIGVLIGIYHWICFRSLRKEIHSVNYL
jgi:hypothetical protein